MISLIVPTYNKACQEIKPLGHMKGHPLISEIILADTGTLGEVEGALVVNCPKGRGLQLIEGARAARSDWLLFLHADTFLTDGWEETVRNFIESENAIKQAAYFRFKLDEGHAKAKRLEKMVAWRSNKWGMPYGDQGLLISRRFYERLGGYKPLVLMEDVEFVKRITPARLVPLGGAAITSAEKYEKAGYFCRSLKNLFCLGLYHLGVPVQTIAKIYG